MIAVVTDSTSDIDPALAAQYDITVVPLFVIFGETRYRDGVDLSRDEFYRKMREGGVLPTTSQPTAAMFEEAYRPRVEAGQQILSVHIAGGLSGTINAAKAAMEQFPGARIELIDSGTVSAGCALLALRAAEMARRDATMDDVVAAVCADREREKGFCALPDLTHAVRTGRVSKAQAALGGLLKIVPVLRFGGGAIDVEARVRTFARAQDTMVEAALRGLGEVARARIAVVHAHDVAAGRALEARVRARLKGEPERFDFFEVGPAVATHAGEGAVGLFAVAG